jgi:tRNA dimethylallyltransferase
MTPSITSPRCPVILIMGPTGAGKTDLALRLAARFAVEIVSVDSAMVYRGLDIGTGKPDARVLAQFPHHLVDIVDPSQPYSAGAFVTDARRAIDAIRARGRIPLLVGGTMLYFRALQRGLSQLPQANAAVRAEIDTDAAQRGWPALHAELALIDARAAARIQPKDGQRIQRALEVFRISGKTLSELHDEPVLPDPDLAFHAYAWSPSDRSRLYTDVELRFHNMMAAGLLEEVQRLYARGDLTAQLPAIRSVGYRQLWEHLRGESALDLAVQRAIFATRQLARRQLIWLRAETHVHWIDTLDATASSEMERAVATLSEA